MVFFTVALAGINNPYRVNFTPNNLAAGRL